MVEHGDQASGSEVVPQNALLFTVYDISDFYPRGSFLPVNSKPPYPISVPDGKYQTVEEIIRGVQAINPKSRIEEEIGYMRTDFKGKIYDATPGPRIPPEQIHKLLISNYLRQNFGTGTEERKNSDIFSQGDKIVVIRKPGESHVLVIDLKHGHYLHVIADSWNPIGNKDLSPYTNERLPEKPNTSRRWRRERTDPIEVMEKKLPEEDQDQKLKVAHDEGRRTKLAPETDKFFRKMREADIWAKHEMVDDIDNVVIVTDAVHRIAKRIGRDRTISLIGRVRKLGWRENQDFLSTLMDDIAFGAEQDKKNTQLSQSDVRKAFESLFKAQGFYIRAIVDLPWNKTGAEPLDTFINVFWFRYRWYQLKTEWDGKNRYEDIQYRTRKYFKQAQIERILAWAEKVHPEVGAQHLKDLKEAGIKYTMWEVGEVAGPLNRYFDKGGLRKEIARSQARKSPSSLTKLLWSSLKWASPEEHKNKFTINISDLHNSTDPMIWEERIPDPVWQEIGDWQGRLVLPGESMDYPMHHLKSRRGGLMNQFEKQLAFAMEQRGDEITIADVASESQHTNARESNPKSFESVIATFKAAVAQLSPNQLKVKIEAITTLQKAVVLQRLGYSLDKTGDNIAENRQLQMRSAASYPIAYLIYWFFDQNPRLYYKEIKKINRILGS